VPSTAGASSHIGGTLSYELGVGVDHAAFEEPPIDWTDVAVFANLRDGEPIKVDAAGVDVLLLRRGDTVTAIGNTCPHLGAPLHEGKIDDDCVHCPWHDSVFRLDDGALVHGPSATSVDAYQVRVVNGQVSIRVEDAAARQDAAMQSG